MPFKSKAQRRKFYALKAQGKMDQKTIDAWERETTNKKQLPERVKQAAESLVKTALKRETVIRAINQRLQRSIAGSGGKPQLTKGKHLDLQTGELADYIARKIYPKAKGAKSLPGLETSLRRKALDKIHAINKATKYRRPTVFGGQATVPKMITRSQALKLIKDYESGKHVSSGVKNFLGNIKVGEIKKRFTRD